MTFKHYLEEEDDKPYFTTNSLGYYYDKMEGFAEKVEQAAKILNVTKEEVEKRITFYIEQNKNELDQHLAQWDGKHEQNKNELDQRLAQWDGKLETFDSSVETLLSEWVDDGTLSHVIDSTLIDQKIAPVTALLAEKAEAVRVQTVENRLALASFARFGYLDGDYLPFNLGFSLYRQPSGVIEHDYPLLFNNAKVYVSWRDGVDTNNGLSVSTPVKSIEQALTVANGLPNATVDIMFLERVFERTTSLQTTLTKNINFVSNQESGTVISTAYSPQTYAWTADGEIFRTNRTATVAVFDTAAKDFRGNPQEMRKMDTLAEVRETPGTWYTDGTLVYVNRSNGLSPASDYALALVLPINVAIVITANGFNFGVDNMHFAIRSNTTSTNALTINGTTATNVLINRSTFRHAKNMGLAITGFNKAYLFNSESAYNRGDGFNYHGDANSKVFEYFCYSHHQGVDSTLVNINATTAHDGMSIVRIGCIGHHTRGPVLGDVNGCKSVNIDCIMHTSLRSAGKEKAGFYFDDLSAVTPGYAYVINSQGGGLETFGLNSDGLIALYVQNFQGSIADNLAFTLFEG